MAQKISEGAGRSRGSSTASANSERLQRVSKLASAVVGVFGSLLGTLLIEPGGANITLLVFTTAASSCTGV